MSDSCEADLWASDHLMWTSPSAVSRDGHLECYSFTYRRAILPHHYIQCFHVKKNKTKKMLCDCFVFILVEPTSQHIKIIY